MTHLSSLADTSITRTAIPDAQPSVTPAATSDIPAKPTPGKLLDSPPLVITSSLAAKTFQAMRQSTYDAKMTVIGNMVDTPEERRAKEERRTEEQIKDDDHEERLQDIIDRERTNKV